MATYMRPDNKSSMKIIQLHNQLIPNIIKTHPLYYYRYYDPLTKFTVDVWWSTRYKRFVAMVKFPGSQRLQTLADESYDGLVQKIYEAATNG